MLTINAINKSKIRMPRAFINLWVQAMVRQLPVQQQKKIYEQSLTVIFLDPLPAKKLNTQFRKKAYPTDVLSFAGCTDEDLGELVICPQVIKKQAQEHELCFQQELGYMLIHGCLHLLGYEHETNAKDARKMFALQDQIFERLLGI